MLMRRLRELYGRCEVAWQEGQRRTRGPATVVRVCRSLATTHCLSFGYVYKECLGDQDQRAG